MMKPFLTLLEQARTSLLQRPCSMASQRPQHPRIAGPTERSARYSSVRRRSRRRAHCLDDASSTPVSARPRCVPPRTHWFTRHHRAAGSTPLFRCINVSATTATHAAPPTPVDAPTTTQEKEPNAATTLGVAVATTATRTKARALAYRALRPSVGTSSMPLSHQGTHRLPTFQNILGKQTPGIGSRTIGLPVKPVAQMITISLFTISHYSWLIRRKHGWSTYRPTPFRVGRI